MTPPSDPLPSVGPTPSDPGRLDLTSGLIGHLGMTFDEITPDRVVLSWTVGAHHHQTYGIVHGGVYCAAVETAASIAAGAWWGDRGRIVGVSNQTDFLRAVREGRLTATATPLHRGRLQQLWQVKITDADDRTVAHGQVRLQNLPNA